MHRMRRWWIIIPFTLIAVAIVGFGLAAWRIARPPAPAPAGMAQRFIDEHRALLEASWPEGEPAWPLLLEAQKTLEATLAEHSPQSTNVRDDIPWVSMFGPEDDTRTRRAREIHDAMAPVIDLLFEATRRERLHESYEDPLDLYPQLSWDQLWSFPNRMLLPELSVWTDAELHRAVLRGDEARAAEALRASLRLYAYFLQRPDVVASMVIDTSFSKTTQILAQAALRGELSAGMCEALIDEIRAAGLPDRVDAAPIVEDARLFEQRMAIDMRNAMRRYGLVDRLEFRLKRLKPQSQPLTPWGEFEPQMLAWHQSLGAQAMERAIDAYYAAVAEWWEAPHPDRALSPSLPSETTDAMLTGNVVPWPRIRGPLDLMRSREAGTILLLRIEAHMAAHGRPPERLEDAAASEETIDPLTGRPFVYEPREDAEDGEWPLALRMPMTLEEFAALMGMDAADSNTDRLWREETTLTAPPLAPLSDEELDMMMPPASAPTPPEPSEQ